MTEQPEEIQIALLNTTNPLPGIGQTLIVCGGVKSDQGSEAFLLTMYKAGVTVTAALTRDEAMMLGHDIKQKAGRMSTLVAVTPPLLGPDGAPVR